MNILNTRILVGMASAGIVSLLAACGGGDSGSAASTDTNVFANLQGTFAVACVGWTDGSSTTGATSGSNESSLTVSDLVGADKANASIRYRVYSSSGSDTTGAQCASTALTTDVTVTGQIRDLGTTKVYTSPAGATMTAKVVELTYTGFTMSKGSLSGSLPLPNATTQVGYVLTGNKLYFGSGGRGSDGLAVGLSRRYGVKQ